MIYMFHMCTTSSYDIFIRIISHYLKIRSGNLSNARPFSVSLIAIFICIMSPYLNTRPENPHNAGPFCVS